MSSKLLIVLAMAVAAHCVPIESQLNIANRQISTVGKSAPETVPILSQDSDVDPEGKFHWGYESGDGTKQEQSGELKKVAEEAGEAIQGSASWTDPEGNQHVLKYVADENGYQPQGADIPVAPEIPVAIARALEYIAAHPQTEETPKKF